MENGNINLKLNDHGHEIKTLKHRIDAMEEKQNSIYDLTLAVNKLAISVEYMAKEQKEQGDRLDTLEKEPVEASKYYKRMILSSIATAIIGAIIGALITLIIK